MVVTIVMVLVVPGWVGVWVDLVLVGQGVVLVMVVVCTGVVVVLVSQGVVLCFSAGRLQEFSQLSAW